MDKRRLSAIMFTDIVGYTRKMGDDEVKMLRLLKEHNAIIEAAASNHEGEIIKRIGDAFLVSFNSALNAVLCAIEIQQALRDYNKDKPPSDQVHIRIGIHLGDIVISEGDVFGDGVNVASRIEPLAHPGGICITRSVYDIVKKKMMVKAVELGPQQLKNVDEAVEVFHLLSETVGIKELRKAKQLKRKQQRWILPVVGLTIILIATGLVLWHQYYRTSNFEKLQRIVENVKIPENRIAILPLRNLSGDDNLDYFAEGIAEELIFRLSRIRELYVYPLSDVLAISKDRRSTQGIKNALGVKYLIQGTMRQDGDSAIVVIEVINTETLDRLISERFTETIKERTRLYNRLAKTVLFNIVGRVSGEDEAALAVFSSVNEISNDLYLQARHAQRKAITWNDQQEVLKLYEAAVSADSNFALARAQLAEAYADIFGEWQKDTSWTTKALSEAQAAISIAPDLPEAHFALGKALEKKQLFEKAESCYHRASELRSDFRASYYQLGSMYDWMSKEHEALTLFKQSLKMNRYVNDRKGEANTLQRIGKVFDDLYEFTLAMQYTDSALVIYRDVYDRKGEADAVLQIGYLQCNQGKDSVALKHWEKCLALYCEIGDKRGENTSSHNIACIWMNMGNDSLALRNFEECLSVARELGDLSLEAYIYTNMSTLYLKSDKDSLELKYLEKALAIHLKIKDQPQAAIIFRAIGDFHKNKGNFINSIKSYQSALAIYQQIEYKHLEAYTLINIGIIYELTGDYSQAQQYFEKGQMTYRLGKWEEDKEGEAWCLWKIGVFHLRNCNYVQALNNYQKALLISNDLELVYYQARILLDIGKTLYKKGDFLTAIDTLHSVINLKGIDEIERDIFHLAILYQNACEVKLKKDSTDLKQMFATLDSLKSLDYKNKESTIEAYSVIGKILIDLGRKEEAEQHLEEGYKMAEESGMKGEMKKYNELMERLKEI
ncbi:tetratricopeptide repeat protein [bacterium]|nr:tetratricopeptide repeat protein [bacterium]